MIRMVWVLCLVVLLGVGVLPSSIFAAEAPVYTGVLSKVAVGGYDPVAYFRVGKPVKGEKRFRTSWKGVAWRFSSAENRDLFLASPEKFAPQYGGYCAWAVSQGYTASGDPLAWTVHGGKLYLNYSLGVRDRWLGDVVGNIERGDRNWPGVLGR